MATTLITSHATLKTVVADYLNRSDLTDAIGNFIANAEDELRLDDRVQNLARDAYDITSDGQAIPSGFDELDSWSYQGSSYYGTLDIVDPGALGELKARHGDTGTPRYAARVGDKFYFAPAPVSGSTYSTIMTYWQTLTDLSAGTNWLVEDYPSIYLYATLLQVPHYLKDQERIPEFERKLEQLLFKLGIKVEDERFSGDLQRRPNVVIGG